MADAITKGLDMLIFNFEETVDSSFIYLYTFWYLAIFVDFRLNSCYNSMWYEDFFLPVILRIKIFKKSADYKCKSSINSFILPLVCHKWQSEMKIILFITETDIIYKKLDLLKSWSDKPSRDPPEDLISHVVHELFSDGWSCGIGFLPWNSTELAWI